MCDTPKRCATCERQPQFAETISASSGAYVSLTIPELGDLVSKTRRERRLSQDALAAKVGPNVNRSMVAHLEQGLRLPAPEALAALCTELGLAEELWRPFEEPSLQRRLHFEATLSDMVGQHVSLRFHDLVATEAAHSAVLHLLSTDLMPDQCFDTFNSVLVYYGVEYIKRPFFDRFLGPDAFKSTDTFERSVRKYQAEAIRMFSTFRVAFLALRGDLDLDRTLRPLAPRVDAQYRLRLPWDTIEQIADECLPDLGYISAEKVRKEQVERRSVSQFLRELSETIRKEGRPAVDKYSEKKRRQMDSLLRKFGSTIQHGFLSPLFVPDPDALLREADSLAPKAEGDIARMEATQRIAERNLARYLSADHMDVYVATSMRVDADFASVNAFVAQLFSHEEIRPLRLRYFNPTQSWIEDRIAKGLVEALMLRRADFTIYMAQKSDTFGKDSEASVALGQGKPVIVYVPKLLVSSLGIDSEELSATTLDDLRRALATEGDDDDREGDETMDDQGLVARLLTLRLRRSTEAELASAARLHWADFDLYGEANRIEDAALREEFRRWLDGVTKQNAAPALSIPAGIRDHVIRMLVAVTVRFEQRARTFREVHPLALQVILSSGVLNGMLVVRSVDSCARLLRGLISNELELSLVVDEDNYRLIERSTRSTLRVISRHRLIANAFSSFFTDGRAGGQ